MKYRSIGGNSTHRYPAPNQVKLEVWEPDGYLGDVDAGADGAQDVAGAGELEL